MVDEAGEYDDKSGCELDEVVLRDLRDRLATYPAPLHRLGQMRSAAPAVYAQLLAELLPIWMADLTASLNRAALEDLAVTLMAAGRSNLGQTAEDDPAIGVLLEELRRDPDLMSQVTALDVTAVRREQRLLLRALLHAPRRPMAPRSSE